MVRNGSLYAVFLICCVLALLHILFPPVDLLAWDVFGYYLYLPAHFIYHDLYLTDQTWLTGIMDTYEPSATLYQIYKLDSGNWVIKYSMGMSVFLAPFFFLAHWLAPILGFPADGFSAPYQYIVAWGAIFYAFVGLFFLRKVLKKFFSDQLTTLLLIIVVFGTNYLQMTGFNGVLLSHTLAFSLYAFVLWATISWHEKPSWPVAFFLGLAMGLLTLVRPSEAVLILVPIFYGISSWDSFKAKVLLVKNNFSHLINAVFGGLIGAVPQLIYWKNVTGNWIHYSYNNPGEGFEFLNPYTLDFLFSFRKGWLVYTPVMIFALIGFWALYKRQRKLFWGMFLFFILNLWVVSSWSCWWYAGGSFSSRSLMPVYVLLSIPLGYLLLEVEKTRWLKRFVFTCIGLFVVLNVFQTYQFQIGVLDNERMTRAYYFRIFGKTSVTAKDRDLLLVKRPLSRENEKLKREDRYTKELWGTQHFEDQPNGVLALTANQPFSPAFEEPYNELTTHDHAWLRISAKLLPLDSAIGAPPLVVVHFSHEGKTYQYHAGFWPTNILAVDQWSTFSMDYLTPEVRSGNDPIKVYIWNQNGGNFLLDDVSIEVFQPNF